MEEACAQIKIDRMIAVYGIPQISQTQVFFLADLITPEIAPGDESLEVGLFDWDSIPWGELAFSTVKWALEQARMSRENPNHPVELKVKRFQELNTFKSSGS